MKNGSTSWSLIFLFAISGCWSPASAPSESDAQAVWHHIAVQNHVDGVRELVSLKKTNGQTSKVQGTEVYTLSYEARVRYLRPVAKWRAGDVQVVDSNYGFQRTEKGWQGPDGTIYTKLTV